MITKNAIVEWIPQAEGGRSKPPLGVGIHPYAPEVRFLDDPWPPTGASWSLVIVKREQSSTNARWNADVNFLVDEAPHDSLTEGREFELYEGNKCVARGKIRRVRRRRTTQR